jgi:microsomal dipeptidase-like Zn-dependent dipeptidase
LSRALAQIHFIDQVAATSQSVTLIRTRKDLEKVQSQHSVGLLLWMEGADPIVGDPSRVRLFYEHGVRAIMLTHLYNNALAGSSSPAIPLTNFYWGSAPDLAIKDARCLRRWRSTEWSST